MERLIRYFVERHLLVHVMVAVVVVLGYVTATRSPREGMPNVELPTVLVRATLAGAAARDVETKLTIPLEEAIEEVDGVESFHTVISENASVTTVEFYGDFDDSDILEGEQEVRDAIDAITDFPEEMDEEPTVDRLPRSSDGSQKLEGAALRSFAELINKLDSDRRYQGLRKVLTPEGQFLWLCEHHAAQY